MHRDRTERLHASLRAPALRRVGFAALVVAWGVGASGCFAMPAPPAPTYAPPPPPPAPAPAPPAPVVTATGVPGNQVGFSTSGTMLWESDAQLASELDAVAATGAKWIRVSFDWNSVQPNGPDPKLSNWKHVRAARST